jgi:copper chaperone
MALRRRCKSMEKTILKVEGMSCEHCVKAIAGAVGALPGIDGVAVDLEAGTVTVKYDAVQSPLDKIKLEIEDQGYDVVA